MNTRTFQYPASRTTMALRGLLLFAATIACLGLASSPAAAQGSAAPAVAPASSAPATTGSEAPVRDAAPSAGVTTGGAINGSPPDVGTFLQGGPKTWTSPQGLSSALQILLLLTVLTLAPAILLMTTSFVRIVVVLGLLRQAIGTQQLPPSQVVTSLALFMTLFIMGPTWREVYSNSIQPYTTPGSGMTLEKAWEEGSRPIRRFMSRQIEIAGNSDDVWLFYRYSASASGTPPETYDDVPTEVLLPAFMLSELKTAFLIGFQIYLPFLILDMVISSVTIAMGMVMLPPVMISLPFKLLLFVLVDGWHLVVGMLLESFGPLGPGG